MKKQFKILLFTLIVGSGISCSVAKKDQKAVNRVKADINLLNDVGGAWVKLNPCIPDTLRTGKTITIIDSSFSDEKVESLNKVIDSLLDKNCPTENIDSLRKSIKKELDKGCKPAIVYKNRTDTIPDKRAEQILSNQVSNLTGQITQLKSDNSELKKESKARLFWAIGIGLLGLIIIGLLIYLLFKK